MVFRTTFRLTLFLLLTLIIASVFSVWAASNTVPPSYAGMTTVTLSPEAFMPPQCAGLTLTHVITFTGNGGRFDDTVGSTLILASPNNDHIRNLTASPDCILGGNGNDKLEGGDGNDVLDGGPGNDDCRGSASGTFLSCENIHVN